MLILLEINLFFGFILLRKVFKETNMQVKLNLISALNYPQSGKNINAAQKPASAGCDTFSFKRMNFVQEIKSRLGTIYKYPNIEEREAELRIELMGLKSDYNLITREDKQELFKDITDKYALNKGSSQFKLDLLEHINLLNIEERTEYVNSFLDSFVGKNDVKGALVLWKDVISPQALRNDTIAKNYIKLAKTVQDNDLDFVCIHNLRYITNAEERQESYKFFADRVIETKNEKALLLCIKRLNLLSSDEDRLAYFKKFANYASNSDSPRIKSSLDPEKFFTNEWLEQAQSYLARLEIAEVV